MLNSCTTATACGIIDVVSKSILGKIKNNKKTAHIFIDINPKYDEDIFNIRFVNVVRMSVVDIIYAFIVAILRTKINKFKEV